MSTRAFEEFSRLRPQLYSDYRTFDALIWNSGVDPVLLELCRLLIAGLLGCESAAAHRQPQAIERGLSEAQVAALDDWRRSPQISDDERCCLAIAHKFVGAPAAVTDSEVAAAVRYLGDAGFVTFVQALALFDGFTRFEQILTAV